MANVMTKRGSLDNVVTFEHYCDTVADLQNIPKDQMSLGSVAIVLQGEDNGLEVYMATTGKQWVPLFENGGSDESGFRGAPYFRVEPDGVARLRQDDAP